MTHKDIEAEVLELLSLEMDHLDLNEGQRHFIEVVFRSSLKRAAERAIESVIPEEKEFLGLLKESVGTHDMKQGHNSARSEVITKRDSYFK